MKEIRRSELERLKKNKARNAKKEKGKLTQANKMGKTLYNEPDLELKLSSEMSNSLRNLKVFLLKLSFYCFVQKMAL